MVRPHSSLADATPDEVFHRRRPANRRRRFESRPRYPANGGCAAPRVPARCQDWRSTRDRGHVLPRRAALGAGRDSADKLSDMAVAHSADRGDVCLASERSIKWRASGISETSNPRPKAFSASRFDLVLPAQMSLFSVGEYRWTRTPGGKDPVASGPPGPARSHRALLCQLNCNHCRRGPWRRWCKTPRDRVFQTCVTTICRYDFAMTRYENAEDANTGHLKWRHRRRLPPLDQGPNGHHRRSLEPRGRGGRQKLYGARQRGGVEAWPLPQHPSTSS